MIHSFLLIGQSNAAGRGFFEEGEPLDTCGGRLKVMRNGLWLTMFRPVNPDRSFSGTCFAESFAKEHALAHPDIEVGIIPCADGGTRIEQWLPGEILFENAVNCARLAMRTSVLKGILWHQGEGDLSDEKCALYKERFVRMADGLREALGCPDLPIIVGELGRFLVDFRPPLSEYFQRFNEVLREIGREYHNCVAVSSEGLLPNPDNLHINAASLKEFGIRYYEAYKPFDLIYENGNDGPVFNSGRTAMEML